MRAPSRSSPPSSPSRRPPTRPRLFEESRALARDPLDGGVRRADVHVAQQLGVRMPGSTAGFDSPAAVLREMNALLVSNEPSVHRVLVDSRELPCLYSLDSRYPTIDVSAYERAFAYMAIYALNSRQPAVPSTPCRAV